jgi:hypothetical protein
MLSRNSSRSGKALKMLKCSPLPLEKKWDSKVMNVEPILIFHIVPGVMNLLPHMFE